MPFAMNALWWSLSLCIVLRIAAIPFPPLLLRWPQLSLSVLDDLHEATFWFCMTCPNTPLGDLGCEECHKNHLSMLFMLHDTER